ncbi:hypothetical protein [Oculatella sp. LEGE 06141]|uniref:hypothetical protein n=2 Tax=Oculatella sp. LEGE 06141 TaxID=1828648 RepID=UPI0030DB7B22
MFGANVNGSLEVDGIRRMAEIMGCHIWQQTPDYCSGLAGKWRWGLGREVSSLEPKLLPLKQGAETVARNTLQ